jgi:hypothetical protein
VLTWTQVSWFGMTTAPKAKARLLLSDQSTGMKRVLERYVIPLGNEYDLFLDGRMYYVNY